MKPAYTGAWGNPIATKVSTRDIAQTVGIVGVGIFLDFFSEALA
jgi:hypothetical protein